MLSKKKVWLNVKDQLEAPINIHVIERLDANSHLAKEETLLGIIY